MTLTLALAIAAAWTLLSFPAALLIGRHLRRADQRRQQ